MKEQTAYIYLLLFSVILGSSCSTGRNTSYSRAYHELKTRYNIYHNALESYNNLLENQLTTFPENRFKLISFYPTNSGIDNNLPRGAFDVVINKAEKAINEHSISAKPRRDPSKAHSEDYRAWLKQTEFNPFMSNVWLLLGKAHVQNGDYDRALSVFNEILRIFPDDINLTSEVQIWMLRTYSEMDRFYDAVNMIYILRTRELPDDLSRLFAETYAHYLLKSVQLEDAAPAIRRVIEYENNLIKKKRYQFLLGQIYTLIGDYQNADNAFEELKGFSTPKEIKLTAENYQAAFNSGIKHADSLSQLLKLSIIGETTEALSTTDSTQTSYDLISEIVGGDDFQIYRNAYLRKNINYPYQDSNLTQEYKVEFTTNSFSPHLLILLLPESSERINELLFLTANFNFSNFKLRTFDLTPVRIERRHALKLEPFSSLDDVSNYLQTLQSDSIFRYGIQDIVTPVIISKENFISLRNSTLNEYNAFLKANIADLPKNLSPMFVLNSNVLQSTKSSSHTPYSVISRQKESLQKAAPLVDSVYIEELLSLKSDSITESQPVQLESPGPKTIDERIDELRTKLEKNAAEMMGRKEESSTGRDRSDQLKKREQQREERIRQREREIKERERRREEEIKQRKIERERRLKEQQRD